MPWRDFATALESAWMAAGYRVQRSEGASDFVLTRDGRTTLVSAKRWKAARHGEEAVQTLAARMQTLDASAGLYVALGELSAQAQQLARQQRIDVLDGPALSVVLARMPLK
jgi:restriction system protein